MNRGGIDFKAIIALVVIALIMLVLWNYKQTGRWSVMPVKLTPNEKRYIDLQREMEKVDKQLSKIEKSVAMTTATGGDIWYQEQKELKAKKEELTDQINSLKGSMQRAGEKIPE